MIFKVISNTFCYRLLVRSSYCFCCAVSPHRFGLFLFFCILVIVLIICINRYIYIYSYMRKEKEKNRNYVKKTRANIVLPSFKFEKTQEKHKACLKLFRQSKQKVHTKIQSSKVLETVK